MAQGMQTAEAAIAGAAGTSVQAAHRIGDAFLGTAGKTEFSAGDGDRVHLRHGVRAGQAVDGVDEAPSAIAGCPS
jgi:hypothetical protein